MLPLPLLFFVVFFASFHSFGLKDLMPRLRRQIGELRNALNDEEHRIKEKGKRHQKRLEEEAERKRKERMSFGQEQEHGHGHGGRGGRGGHHGGRGGHGGRG